MQIEKIPATRILPAAYNPRKDLKPGDKEYEKLKKSIERFGYVEPVVWNQRTGNLVGGHQRYKVLVDLGHTDIDCVVVDLDSQKEKALNLALNKIQGDWDEDKLSALMADLDESAFDVSYTGFDSDEIEALLNKFYSKDAIEDQFDIDKAQAEIEREGAVTQRGDIWLLGTHRLMCGDSTIPAEMDRLMEGHHAQCAVTSPPYGVGKEYETAGIEPWFATIRPVIQNITKHADVICWNLGDQYPTRSQFIEPTGLYSVTMFGENGFRPIWIRIWQKMRQDFGNSPYHLVTNKPVQQYEYITAFAGHEPVQQQPPAQEECNDQDFMWLTAFAGHGHKFVKRLTKEERKKWGYAGVWEIATISSSAKAGHSAPFPVELPWRCLKMHSNRGDIVLEPFSGSGTTIIACEQSERQCFAMEISEVYCDLAIRRWEEFTGEKAIRLGVEGVTSLNLDEERREAMEDGIIPASPNAIPAP